CAARNDMWIETVFDQRSAVTKSAPLAERGQGRSGDAVCGFCLPHSGHRRILDVKMSGEAMRRNNNIVIESSPQRLTLRDAPALEAFA
ncbi:MAG: hypothetical protein U0401_04320, partial [Anaerolineae bacterium]